MERKGDKEKEKKEDGEGEGERYDGGGDERGDDDGWIGWGLDM